MEKLKLKGQILVVTEALNSKDSIIFRKPKIKLHIHTHVYIYRMSQNRCN